MPFYSIIWDLDDDPDGNVQHCAEHGVTKDEVEEAIANGIRRSTERRIMKRIIRDRRLTAEEAAKYRKVREQVAKELPELVARHHEQVAALDSIDDVVNQLKAAREEKGLSLADVSERTGMDSSALSKLESGERANPTIATLVRYADAVGLRLQISLIDVR